MAVPDAERVPGGWTAVRADPRYVAARNVLLDALEILDQHSDAIVVVGAQAVYLRTGEAGVAIAPYTTDGDLAVDAGTLADSPLLGDLMRDRFELSRASSGAEEPGIWIQTVEIGGEEMAIAVDLIVPSGIAPPGGSRGARLGPHGKWAARKARGLEAAIVDNDLFGIASLDPRDDRCVERRVAGATALLIAKAHKIHDRLDEAGRTSRLVDKDAADVYRLMRSTAPGVVNEVMERLLADSRTAEPTQQGLLYLRQQFGARRATGVEMAVHSLRVGVPEDRIRAVCSGFVRALG